MGWVFKKFPFCCEKSWGCSFTWESPRVGGLLSRRRTYRSLCALGRGDRYVPGSRDLKAKLLELEENSEDINSNYSLWPKEKLKPWEVKWLFQGHSQLWSQRASQHTLACVTIFRGHSWDPLVIWAEESLQQQGSQMGPFSVEKGEWVTKKWWQIPEAAYIQEKMTNKRCWSQKTLPGTAVKRRTLYTSPQCKQCLLGMGICSGSSASGRSEWKAFETKDSLRRHGECFITQNPEGGKNHSTTWRPYSDLTPSVLVENFHIYRKVESIMWLMPVDPSLTFSHC